MNQLEDRIRVLSPEQRRQLRARLEARRIGSIVSIIRVSRDSADFPLSFAQERLWFLDQLAPGNTFYNLSFAQRLSFAVLSKALETALSDLVRRHEALRTVFVVVDGDPVQRVLDEVPVNCSVLELGHLPLAVREEEIQRVMTEFAQTPFDLSEAPLFRAKLIRTGAFDAVFLFVIHHIVADAWSLEILFRDLATLYTDSATGRPSALGELKVQYVDFSIWQRAQLKGKALERHLAYWRSALKDLPALDLPTDRPRPAFQQFRGGQVEISIPAETVDGLRKLGSKANATPFMVLLAAFYILLHRYCRQQDLVVGTPIANRGRAELEEVVGFFANTLVLRCDLSGTPSFHELLKRVRAMALDAFNHQDLPFSRLVAALRPRQDLSRNPLFQISFQLISSAQKVHSPARATDWENSLLFEHSTAIFDLTLNLWDTGAEIRGSFEYNSDLFERASVRAMAGHYLNLLGSAIAHPDDPIQCLPLLTVEERQRLLDDWNETQSTLPVEACLHEIFERQVVRTPDAPALCMGEKTVSYRELANRVHRLAGRFLAIDSRCRRNIGLLIPPGFDMAAAILAILESGNAYVPLDVTAPSERIATMLEDASIELVVTCRELAPRLAGCDARCFILDSKHSETEITSQNSAVRSSPDDGAYVIFTSGSTGRPKGVTVSHRSVATYLHWCEHTYPVSAGVGAPLTSPISSDMSVTSLFLPLFTGKALHFLEGEDLIEALDQALRDGPKFSFVKLTPSHLVALRNLSDGVGIPSNTHAFIVGGEPLQGEDLEPWREDAPGIPIYNEYGPTEATVGCCVFELRAGNAMSGPIPIGWPIAGNRLYVVDDDGAPVGVGVPGELYIGGPGVAIGYASASGKTAACFVPDHLSGEPGQRLYRTGDLVRHRPDGALEFLGRLDRQIKIHGHRIEPGDVEAALCWHTGVVDAVVLAKDYGDHDRRLVAYVVPTDRISAEGLSEELRGFLREKLPVYMIPGRIVPVDRIPLTSSGKTDTAALQALDVEVPAAGGMEGLEPPRTSLEEVLVRVFADVLKIDDIGVHKDFFAHLGGDSLLATRVVSMLREVLQIDLPLRTIFEAPTVRSLATSLQTDRSVAERLEKTAALLIEVLEMNEEQVEAELITNNSRQDGLEEMP